LLHGPTVFSAKAPQPAFAYHFFRNLSKKFMTYAQKQARFLGRMNRPHPVETKGMVNLSY
jgi:hypothetical protein